MPSHFPLYRASAEHAAQINTLNPELPRANVGLWFTRFYDGFDPAWEIDADSKRQFIEATVKLSDRQDNTCVQQVRAFAVRQRVLCEALGGQCMTLTTEAPLVTCTGLSHPVENGFTFHPTLGLPYLPAAGVKGLLRAWTEVWAGLSDDDRRERVALWFGTAKGAEDPQEDAAGALVFFDAVPADRVTLECDVLTPHMGGWYERGDRLSAQNFATVAPGDWHSPVPSPFLVLKKGAKLQFGIAPRLTGHAAHDAAARAAVAPALEALKAALEWIGAGAKTAAGYGRMGSRPEAQRQSDQDLADHRHRLAEQAAAKARAQAKQAMSPADLAMADLFDQRTDKNQDERAVLFSALKAGKLAEHRQEAALRLKALMQEQKRWKEKSEKKNPEKDQPHQDTLLVQKWLSA